MKKIFFYFFSVLLANQISAQKQYFVAKDGSGNFTKISQVNNTKLNSGDMVSFKSGEKFDDAILNCKGGVTYTSYGNTGRAIIGNATASTFNATVNITGEHVTLDNLKLQGYYSPAYIISCNQNYLTVKNCEIVGGDNAHVRLTAGIYFTDVNKGVGHKILYNEIHDLSRGIMIARPYNTEIGYNKMYDFWWIHGQMDKGGAAIGGTTSQGDNDTWDANYTFRIHHNDIYNFEYVALAIGFSKMIIEYNNIHDNLDERIYRGGVKHGSIGKLYDTGRGNVGGIGLIFRYNYIHDLIRYGQKNYTYAAQTDEMVNSKKFKVLSTDNGTGKAVYQYAVDQNPDYNNFGLHYGDGTGESPDNVISGQGYGAYYVHNNIFNNCSNAIIGRASNSYTTFRDDLRSYVVNNTIINCGWLDYITEDNGIMQTEWNSESPHTVLNNIIDYTLAAAKYAGRWKTGKLILDNNIYTRQGGITTKAVNSGALKAAYFENLNALSIPSSHEYYLKNPNWNNQNGTIFASNIGVNGVYIPDVRIKKDGNAYNTGMKYSSIGDNYHGYGSDPTSRSFAYDFLGKLRTANDIGAVGTDGSTSSSPDTENPNTQIFTPTITKQPGDITIEVGNNASISIEAKCDDPIGYQWWKSPYVSDRESKIVDNEKFSGSTTKVLTIKNVSFSESNTRYVCEVYNTKDPTNLWINSSQASIIVTQSNSGTGQTNNGLKVILEATYDNGQMNALLDKAEIFPLNQPYNMSPWNFTNEDNLSSTKSDFVDWLYVELRDNTAHTVYKKTAILKSNGLVINSDGSSFSFSNITSGNYYIVIHHRNHLSIMTSEKVAISTGEKINYDFTKSQESAYGKNSLTDLGNGNFGMMAGDADANGVINNLDFGIVANNIPFKGYAQGDLNMDGVINVLDYSLIDRNILKKSNIP